jgi:hypothetical protein
VTSSVQVASSTSHAQSREPAAGGGRRAPAKAPSQGRAVPVTAGGDPPLTETAGERSALDTFAQATDDEPPREFDPFEHEELPPSMAPGRSPAPAKTTGGGQRQPSLEREAPAGAGDGAAPNVETIRSRWNVVVEELKRGRAVTTAALLAEAEPLRCEGSALVVGFRYSILRDKWERGDNKQRLTAALRAVFGHAFSTRSEVTGDETGAAGEGSGATVESEVTAPTTAGAIPAALGATAAPEASPTMDHGGAAARPPARRSAHGSAALEGEALLHEVIATFEGEIVEPAGD